MPAGYLSLHADLLVHGSQPNHSSRRRCGAEIKSSFYRYLFVQKKRSFCQDRLGTTARQVAEAEGVSAGFTLRYCASDCMPVGWGLGTEEGQEVKKRISFAPFGAKNDHFTKTGSGQTQGKLKKSCVFSYRVARAGRSLRRGGRKDTAGRRFSAAASLGCGE